MRPLHDYIQTETQEDGFELHKVVVAVGPEVKSISIGDKIKTNKSGEFIREEEVFAVYD